MPALRRAQRGSLASLTTRAERDGDTYVVNGSKIWTTLPRTTPSSGSSSPAPTRTPSGTAASPTSSARWTFAGITTRPVVDMTTAHSFCEVFFEDVRLPADLLVGEENDGWRLARATLANERVSLSSSGALWGAGPSPPATSWPSSGPTEASATQSHASAPRPYMEGEVLRLIQLRMAER